MQTAWSTADAESRVLKSERTELDERMKSPKIELGVVTRLEADGRRDAASFIDQHASLVQAKLSSVQAEFVTERTKVYELNSELTAAKSQLRDWDEQYDFQIRTGAGNNDQQPEQKGTERSDRQTHPSTGRRGGRKGSDATATN